MFRRRARRPRKPKVYRIPVETYLVALAIAFALSVALSMLAKPKEVHYLLPHSFSVKDDAFLPSAHALSDPSVVSGTRVRILENGDRIFPAMLDAISRSTRTINLEAYIFWSGKVGSKFRDALSDRARNGVEVRLILDAVGSPKSKLAESDVLAMRQAGCVIHMYHPLKPWMLNSFNNRTHRRILVIDGKVGFTGGVGFADEWLGDADGPAHWRETQLEVEGPVVAQLQAAFLDNWAESRGEALLGEKFYPKLVPEGPARSQVTHSTARAPSSATKLLYGVSIAAAQERIYLSNSYFLPDRETSAALIEAAKRGVDVEIIVPGAVNDVPATKAGGRSSFGALLNGGVKIFEYQPTMFHPKTLVVDGIFSIVGSANFDNRSFRLNDEIDLSVYDEAIGKAMEELFRKDRGRSRRYTREQYLSRSWKDRLFEWAVLPFRSQL
ncbi:MAG: phospholipase D-like domain-containing protein [Acidobacteriota bacterium]